MRLDSSGNLGLGVTPSAWTSGVKAFQVGLGASVFGSTASYNNTNLTANIFYNSGGSPIYQGTDFASFYQQVSGSHRWFNAPSGTAGNTITFTQAMTLDASGNLGIGQTSPAVRLEAAGNLRITNATVTNSAIFQVTSDATGSNGVNLESTYYGSGGFGPIRFTTSNTERMRIAADGNVGIGTSSPSTKLHVAGTGTQGITVERTDASTAGLFQLLSGTAINVINSTTAKPIAVEINGTERMRIDSSGNLLVGTTSNNARNARLALNGDSVTWSVGPNSSNSDRKSVV
jgi:hypothetical protein